MKDMTAKKILIIDEDNDFADIIRNNDSFANYNLTVTCSSSLKDEVINELNPDLLIIDYSIDHDNEFKYLDIIKSNHDEKLIPIIYLTNGNNIKEEAVQIENTLDVLNKPVDLSRIKKKMDGYFARLDKIENKYKSKIQNLSKNISLALPHEFRTSLIGILGFSNEIFNMTKSTSKLSQYQIEDINMMIQSILYSGKNLNRMAENFLLYSELQMIESDPEKKNRIKNCSLANPIEIINEIIESLTIDNERSNDIEIEIEYSVLSVSYFHFYKIIYELIDNAIKFSSKGDKIYISAKGSEFKMNYEIVDAGRGMTKDQIDQIDAYVQFDRNIYEQQGAGLGLSIAKSLVEFYGGDFVVCPNVEKGITVRFDLPIK